MTIEPGANQNRWRFSDSHLVFLLLTMIVLIIITYDGLELMVKWWQRDEYSHGYLLPIVAGFFVWQKQTELSISEPRTDWLGIPIVIIGLLSYLVGELGSLYTLIQYSFLCILAGVIISSIGRKGFRILLPPYLILFFMVPLPNFLYFNLSSQLQLISSKIGVSFIRLFDISVFLEGNVIDLGTYKLQVVEACSGLRYLFPLTALGFIAAYIFKGVLWKKAVIFLSTIPITVLMNSFRIGVIGIMVEYWGQNMAEGFLHDFEGWIIFMVCAAVLLLEMWILTNIGKDKLPLWEAFVIEMPAPIRNVSDVLYRKISAPLMGSFVLLIGMAVVSQLLPNREEIIPKRLLFNEFPVDFDGWRGTLDQLEPIYVDSLKFDDYLLADYSNGIGALVNLYTAYYGSQRKGASVHSPKGCLPGGGWRIQTIGEREVNGVNMGDGKLLLNRAVIQQGDTKQIVYYWFQERGRTMTNEYLVKWYLFWDALTRRRTDGALVRLTATVKSGQDVSDVDQILEQFTRDVSGKLSRFIPD